MPDKDTRNAIIAAFWLAFLAILGVNLIGNTAMFGSPLHDEVHAPEKFGYPIEVAEEAPVEADAAKAERVNALPMVAAASVEEGAAVFKKCGACHTAEAGGANKTGPNLHGIVGRPVASHEGFKYTESLTAIGGNWTYEKLEDYVENPKHLAPKGSMSFIGLKKPEDRAALIKFLMSMTDNPPPLPTFEAPAAAPAEAPAAAPAAAPSGN